MSSLKVSALSAGSEYMNMVLLIVTQAVRR